MNGSCPSCRQPTTPGATHCTFCRAPLHAAAPQQGYGPPPQHPYGAPPQQGYGPPPQQGHAGPAQHPHGSPQQGYGAPPQQPYGAPPQHPYGAPPQQQPYGAPPQAPQGPWGTPPAAAGYGGMASAGHAPQPASTGMSGCGIAAIIGGVVALLGGVVLVLILVAVASGDDDERTSSASTPTAPVTTPSAQDDVPRADVPDTGALRPLLHDRMGAYRLVGVGEVTNLGTGLQGGIVDSKGAKYVAPDGTEVTLLMIAYASPEIARGKIDLVETVLRSEPGHVVARSNVLNKKYQVVGARVRATGVNPQKVYWTHGKLLSIVTANAPHAVGLEAACPF